MTVKSKKQGAGSPRCGLCGKAAKLTKTECCGRWICDDEGNYVLFSYARNSCLRNHRRYTLCGYHFAEGHAGEWRSCADCLKSGEPEMTAWYGTNEYNFERLKKVPSFKPKLCAGCGTHISLTHDAYSSRGDEYWCMRCTERTPRKPKKKP